jgi:hypothetical protein
MQVVGQIITTTIDVSIVVLDNSVIHLDFWSSLRITVPFGNDQKIAFENLQLKSMIERRAK